VAGGWIEMSEMVACSDGWLCEFGATHKAEKAR